MKRKRRLHIAIIGAGKVGTVLGKILAEDGALVVSIVSKSIASARRAGRFIGCRNVSTDLAAIPRDTDYIYITTPHDAVASVARALSDLANLDFSRLRVCHASGMLTADVLSPLAAKGATVFSFHPLQTFPRDFSPRAIVLSARKIYYGVDGNPAALRSARQLARALDGAVIEVPPQMRVFYHAACVLASNHLTAMLGVLDTMYKKIQPGDTKGIKVFHPIIAATLANIERTSPSEALSGPVARGGVDTVAGHLEAIRKFAPGLIPYFSALTLETVRLARAKGSITAAQADSFVDLLSQENS